MPPSRALIVCSFSGTTDRLRWIIANGVADVALIDYGAVPVEAPPVRYLLRNRGYKVPNAALLFKTYPETLDYDEVLFVDDDLVAADDLVARWLELHRAERLDVSQPSLAAGSDTHWVHLLQKPGKRVARGEFVECQCFCLSKRALHAALPFFDFCVTGFGLDVGLFYLANAQGLRTGVLHGLAVFHPTRPRAESVRRTYKEADATNDAILKRLSARFGVPYGIARLSRASRYLGSVTAFKVRALELALRIFDTLLRRKRKVW